ncbi:unnamed protein product [Arctia plantaginis]|uniref:Uncharacterized protein n=1 Tax=Arctia plantaginis TaxID=874455 RepID=A0A8S0ZKI7_ARCPL|nr:unnamed protein product [Arctia plantaginis]CAB3253299.1 unnamed protein product [Arctia plantaginis]
MNQMQQDLQNELTTANQLLRLISVELQQIKHLTNNGGEFESHIKQNASLIKTLANLQQVDLEKLPSFTRKLMDNTMHSNQNVSYDQHNTFRNDSELSSIGADSSTTSLAEFNKRRKL